MRGSLGDDVDVTIEREDACGDVSTIRTVGQKLPDGTIGYRRDVWGRCVSETRRSLTYYSRGNEVSPTYYAEIPQPAEER